MTSNTSVMPKKLRQRATTSAMTSLTVLINYVTSYWIQTMAGKIRTNDNSVEYDCKIKFGPKGGRPTDHEDKTCYCYDHTHSYIIWCYRLGLPKPNKEGRHHALEEGTTVYSASVSVPALQCGGQCMVDGGRYGMHGWSACTSVAVQWQCTVQCIA